jgi:hypothetical protein
MARRPLRGARPVFTTATAPSVYLAAGGATARWLLFWQCRHRATAATGLAAPAATSKHSLAKSSRRFDERVLRHHPGRSGILGAAPGASGGSRHWNVGSTVGSTTSTPANAVSQAAAAEGLWFWPLLESRVDLFSGLGDDWSGCPALCAAGFGCERTSRSDGYRSESEAPNREHACVLHASKDSGEVKQVTLRHAWSFRWGHSRCSDCRSNRGSPLCGNCPPPLESMVV